MAPHSSTLAWKIPWMEEPGRLQSMRLLRVGNDRMTSLSLFTFIHWRRKWQPAPVFLSGESQERWSLMGCHLWGCTESDTTEATQQQQQQQTVLEKASHSGQPYRTLYSWYLIPCHQFSLLLCCEIYYSHWSCLCHMPLSIAAIGSPGGSHSKESACNVGDPGSIPGLGRSPEEGNGNALQYSCLRISWTKEPGGLQSMWSQRVRHN